MALYKLELAFEHIHLLGPDAFRGKLGLRELEEPRPHYSHSIVLMTDLLTDAVCTIVLVCRTY